MSKESNAEILKLAAEEYETAKAPFKIIREKTALLVIDLLEAFVSPDGNFFCPEFLKIIPKVKKLIQICRKVKIPVIYAIECFHPKGYDKGLMWDMPLNKGIENALIEGSKGVRIYHETEPAPGDIKIIKKRYSAFYETNLNSILRNLGRDTVIICGCMTNYCCGHTARDAFSRDYKVIFGSDVTATDNPEIHRCELKTLRRGYALIMSFDEIIKELKTHSKKSSSKVEKKISMLQ